MVARRSGPSSLPCALERRQSGAVQSKRLAAACLCFHQNLNKALQGHGRLTWRRGFHCTNTNGNTCVALATTGTQISVTTGRCVTTGLASVSLATFPDVITVTPSNSAAATQTGVLPGPQVAPTAVTREILLMAPMFQLNFQSADLLSSTTTTHTGSTSGASSTPTDSGSPAQQASSSGGSNGLSTGATVGIGVGAALAGILLASVAAWLWVRRRRRAQMQPPAAATSQMPELPGHGGPWDGSGPHAAYKTYSTQSPGWAPVSHEMDASYGSAATELPSGYGSMAAEMPTEPRYR